MPPLLTKHDMETAMFTLRLVHGTMSPSQSTLAWRAWLRTMLRMLLCRRRHLASSWYTLLNSGRHLSPTCSGASSMALDASLLYKSQLL